MLRHIGSIPSPFPTKSLLTLLGLGALAVLLLWPSRSKPQSADPREQIRATKGAFVAQPPRYTAVPARAEIPLEQQMAERLLAAIESESDPARRDQIAETEAKHIPRALWGAVLNWLQEQPESASIAAALRGTMLRWAWEEPTGAAAWVIEHAAGDFRREALGIVGAGWARLQPDELKSWAELLPPAERDWVLLHAASYLGRTDLQQFAAWQSALSPSRERDQLLRDTARLWVGRAPLEVAALIARGPTDGDAEWRRDLAQALAGELANANEPATVSAVVAALPSGPEQKTVLTGLVTSWSTREPELVAAWLDGVSELPLRAELSALLASNWLEKDAAAARAWMRTLPSGPVADAVEKRIAESAAAHEAIAEGVSQTDALQASTAR